MLREFKVNEVERHNKYLGYPQSLEGPKRKFSLTYENAFGRRLKAGRKSFCPKPINMF